MNIAELNKKLRDRHCHLCNLCHECDYYKKHYSYFYTHIGVYDMHISHECTWYANTVIEVIKDLKDDAM